MTKDWLKKISAWGAKIAPKVEVFGLQVTDGLIRFHALGKGISKTKDIAAKLPPGVVQGGKVVDKDALTKALMELHKKVSRKSKENISVILSIPINNIYLQPFNLPVVAESSLAESADLNMRMISPIDANKAYFDWQKVNTGSTDVITVIGGFAGRDLIDDFIEAVQGASFGVAAVEFSSLSLMRAAHELGLADKKKPQYILNVSQSGLEFSVSHGGSLYFHYFSPWAHYQDGKTINQDKLIQGLVDETRKVLNFYSTNFKSSEVKNMVLVSQGYVQEITKAIQTNFPGVELKAVQPSELNCAMGAAMRGKISRANDYDISLASFSSVELFRTNELTNFSSIWRNTILTVFGFILLIIFTSVLVLQNEAKDLVAQDPLSKGGENTQELVRLSDQAKEFNTTVNMLKEILDEQARLHPLLEKITMIMGTTIDLSKAQFNTGISQLSLSGTGVSEDAVVDFKDALEQEEKFEDVKLPLSELKTLPGGSAQFSLTLIVKDLDF